MADLHDIVAFSCDGEKILGIVIDHYTNPLDDFYVIYANYTLHKVGCLNKDASTIISDIIFPAGDEAIANHKMQRQHLKDIAKYHKEIDSIKKALESNIDIKELFEE